MNDSQNVQRETRDDLASPIPLPEERPVAVAGGAPSPPGAAVSSGLNFRDQMAVTRGTTGNQPVCPWCQNPIEPTEKSTTRINGILWHGDCHDEKEEADLEGYIYKDPEFRERWF